ncbi:CU044_2847 family protein [Kitasatospora sp. NPDC057692]|uniref:CU044_2847 family protein n=1 Tax=Kitasatospora sp. NPDC057692 TaxID=3346215 RepID=UPI0036A3B916
MAGLARIPLEDGGWVLIEAPGGAEGPVKAGRVGEAIRELPTTLRGALVPVTTAAHVALDELRRIGPDEIAVEFGVDLSVEAGAVITRSGANCHLLVRALWRQGGPGAPAAGRPGPSGG